MSDLVFHRNFQFKLIRPWLTEFCQLLTVNGSLLLGEHLPPGKKQNWEAMASLKMR